MKLILVMILGILLVSCVTNRKTTYLQPGRESKGAALTSEPDSVAPRSYRVQVSDNLYIRVITPDPKWAAMFNTLPVTTTTYSATEQSTDLISYPVLPNGTIDIPYVGEVAAAGKTLPEIKKILEMALADYINDYDVTVRLVNNYVSLLGDVTHPGRYPIYKDQLNIFQALAMAGDMGDYSNRASVQIIRQTPEGAVIREFDLTNREILNSEYFYVMPNDVIYAQPMKGKFFKMDAFPFSIILSAITTAILLLNYVK